jgi:C-terminal processing protease CtpA/Prc
MEFPASEYRLLALFRFWSVIDNFYPYKNLIGDTWRDVLERFIPKFEADKTALEYQQTVLEMVSEIHDTHGFVRGTDDFNEALGGFTVPVYIRYLEGKAVVWKVLDDKLPVKVGDTIINVDGETEQKRREYLSRFVAASTPQSLFSRVSFYLLRGPKDSKAKMTVLGADGKAREIETARSQSLNDPNFYRGTLRTKPVVEVLPENIGYVDLGRLQNGEVNAMFEKIKNTKAVIFDMRGYPNGTAWSIAPRLTDKTAVGAALFSRPIPSANSFANSDFLGGANYTFTQPLPERLGDVYRGKVVMLIDESAISQAEHTCLFFESATDVTFIGMPTAGANGDVTNMVLPGGIIVNFSGHAVRHADGRQLQRLGIQPTIKVSPTVKGIAEGRDEILEAAVKYIQTAKK